MRVLQVIKSLGRGGAEMLLLEGHRASASADMSYVYFLPWKDALVRPLAELGASVKCLPARGPLGILSRVSELAAYARATRTDLIHCHLPWAGVAGRLAGRIAGIPVVYSEHNLMEEYRTGTRAANLATWRLQSAVIAVSDDVKGSAERNAGRTIPVEVIRNGVSLVRFSRNVDQGREARDRLSIPVGAPVVGTVAVLRAQKRLDVWFQAAARFHHAHPDAHFLVVGDGPLMAPLVEEAHRHGLTSRTHFVGLQAEVRPFLSAMDVYMMSSDYEGLPVAMLEAMSMALPVVTTAVGGIPEAVSDGVNGFLVRKGDADGLANSLQRVFEGSPRKMGEAGRLTVQRSFSVQHMQARIRSVYEKVVSGCP